MSHPTDAHTSLAQLREWVADFIAARNWEVYHTPKNLSTAIAIEAAELMEHFLWLDAPQASAAMADPARKSAVADEMADVLIYTLSLANALEIDVAAAVKAKLERNEGRFPAEQWRGRAKGVQDAHRLAEG
ncbi:MAG: nucleotide pyrophosphohydrolase [Anaerolineae bacterium]|nr:nucleotide pyrophosphohydrolase [Anaerolineae bacterium]